MANGDPWIDWGWLKMGPFTPTQEDRVAAERRAKERNPEGGISSIIEDDYAPWLYGNGFSVGPLTTNEGSRQKAADTKGRMDKGARQSAAAARKELDSLPVPEGDYTPWLYGSGISVGPFTMDDASRQKAAAAKARLDKGARQSAAADRKEMEGGIGSLLPQTVPQGILTPEQQAAMAAAQPQMPPVDQGMPMTGPSNFMAGQMQPQGRPQGPPMLTPEQQAAAAQTMPMQLPADVGNPAMNEPYPQSARDWSIYQGLTSPFVEGGTDAWRAARAYDEAAAAKGGSQAAPQAAPQSIPVTEDRADRAGFMPLAAPQASPEAVPQTPAGTPAGPTLTPQQQAIEDIKTQKAMIDQLYPARTYDDTDQKASDAYAEGERERAQAMANLAFFSGVTKGAGGGWEGVGQGLAAAGQAHATGFARYHEALQNKANRSMQRANERYADNTSRTDAALKLYEGSQNRAATLAEKLRVEGRDDRKQDREEQKQTTSEIDKYFTEKLKATEGNDMMPADPASREKVLREWRISRQNKQIIEEAADLTAPSS